MRHFTSGLNSFQVLAGVTPESELKLVAGHGLLDGIVMAVKLIPNGCPNKIGTVRVEPFLHEEIQKQLLDTKSLIEVRTRNHRQFTAGHGDRLSSLKTDKIDAGAQRN